VSYALLDPTTGAVESQYVDKTINPGDWVKGTNYAYVKTGHDTGIASDTGRVVWRS
jgi:hypothetical protein